MYAWRVCVSWDRCVLGLADMVFTFDCVDVDVCDFGGILVAFFFFSFVWSVGCAAFMYSRLWYMRVLGELSWWIYPHSCVFLFILRWFLS
jgi:hypothetical protein